MKNIYTLIILSLFVFTGFSQGTFLSNATTVTWTTPAHWDDISGLDADGIPDADDDVWVLDGHTLSLSGAVSYSCNNFTLFPNYNSSGSNAVLLMKGFLTGPTLNVLGDFTMEGDESGNPTPFSLININNANAKLNISGNLSMETIAANDVGAQILFQKKGTITLGGNILFPLTEQGKIAGGTAGGTFVFNGSSTQIIPLSATTFLDFCNITSSNTSAFGLSIDSDLTAANFIGNLTVNSGATFNDGGFNVALTGDGDDVPPGDLSNAGTYTASGTLDIAGSFTNSGTFTSTGCDINLEGNFTNTGTYTYATGDNFTFDGTLASTITGATAWGELTCNNTAGVSVVSGAQDIYEILDIDQGAFDASGGTVTLISNASGTAQMDNIGTGSYTGNLTVQRYIGKSTQSYTSITSPVTGTTLATWQANGVLFSGFPNSDAPAFPFLNTYMYDEPSHGALRNNGWAAATDISNAAGASNNYRAHYIYMDATVFNLSVSGTPITGDVSVPLDYNVGGGPNEDGWNLIGNPYPCAVDWDLIYTVNAGNVIDGYLVYAGDIGNYAWYDGATTGSGTGSGGATKDIPHSQGIWVQSLNGTSLSVTEAHKNTTDAGFLKSTNNFMRIYLTGTVNSFQDEALIFSDVLYSDSFEGSDIPKFGTLDPNNAPTLYTQSSDGVNLTFNKLGVNSVSIPMMAIAGAQAQGVYTLDFEIPVEFMLDGCITMEDLHTGTMIDLRTTTSYSYTTSDTTTTPRFIIHLVKKLNTETTGLTCFAANDGQVVLRGTEIDGSSFELLDNMGNLVNSTIATNDTVIFNNISEGTYEVVTDYLGNCSNGSFFVAIPEPMQVTANFGFVQDTVYLNQGGLLEVSNFSLGTNFSWDFGDGNTSSNVSPSHIYTTPGIYQVMLTSDNDNIGGCTEITSKNAVVMNGPLSISENLIDDYLSTYIENGAIMIEFEFESTIEVELSLVDVNGKMIVNNQNEIVSNNKINLYSTDKLSKGVYFVNIISNEFSISKKLIID